LPGSVVNNPMGFYSRMEKKQMKKFEVEIKDNNSAKKIQRMVLILEKMAVMLDEHKHIQIEITVLPIKKRWFEIWK